ncbi:hypothetical protein PR048_020272 [Dryococelus australis]|uniref:Uncharacterized protein n=1 Tax=Dryococelus australis TaxID=614101 RepID=A0ABQ9H5U6_9NEOP|nr:hypothetical protein PR048_020272 [Dryococelus australis]
MVSTKINNLKIAQETLNKDRTVECVVYFMQHVPVPLPENEVFYLRQLWLYTFGLHHYYQGGAQAYFYMLSECDAGHDANEVISSLNHFIQNKVGTQCTDLRLFSDASTGQNSNYAMVRYLTTLVNTSRFKTFQLCFPTQGHSFLPCDRDFAKLGWGTLEIPEKTRHPAEWSRTIPCTKIRAATLLEIEPGLPGREASSLTATPPRCHRWRKDVTVTSPEAGLESATLRLAGEIGTRVRCVPARRGEASRWSGPKLERRWSRTVSNGKLHGARPAGEAGLHALTPATPTPLLPRGSARCGSAGHPLTCPSKLTRCPPTSCWWTCHGVDFAWRLQYHRLSAVSDIIITSCHAVRACCAPLDDTPADNHGSQQQEQLLGNSSQGRENDFSLITATNLLRTSRIAIAVRNMAEVQAMKEHEHRTDSIFISILIQRWWRRTDGNNAWKKRRLWLRERAQGLRRGRGCEGKPKGARTEFQMRYTTRHAFRPTPPLSHRAAPRAGSNRNSAPGTIRSKKKKKKKLELPPTTEARLEHGRRSPALRRRGLPSGDNARGGITGDGNSVPAFCQAS